MGVLISCCTRSSQTLHNSYLNFRGVQVRIRRMMSAWFDALFIDCQRRFFRDMHRCWMLFQRNAFVHSILVRASLLETDATRFAIDFAQRRSNYAAGKILHPDQAYM